MQRELTDKGSKFEFECAVERQPCPRARLLQTRRTLFDFVKIDSQQAFLGSSQGNVKGANQFVIVTEKAAPVQSQNKTENRKLHDNWMPSYKPIYRGDPLNMEEDESVCSSSSRGDSESVKSLKISFTSSPPRTQLHELPQPQPPSIPKEHIDSRNSSNQSVSASDSLNIAIYEDTPRGNPSSEPASQQRIHSGAQHHENASPVHYNKLRMAKKSFAKRPSAAMNLGVSSILEETKETTVEQIPEKCGPIQEEGTPCVKRTSGKLNFDSPHNSQNPSLTSGQSHSRLSKERVGQPHVQNKQPPNGSPIHLVDASMMMPQACERKRMPPSQRKTNSETGLMRFGMQNFNVFKRASFLDAGQSRENARQLGQQQMQSMMSVLHNDDSLKHPSDESQNNGITVRKLVSKHPSRPNPAVYRNYSFISCGAQSMTAKSQKPQKRKNMMDRVNDLLATQRKIGYHSPAESSGKASEHTQRVETLRSMVLNRQSVGLKKLNRSLTLAAPGECNVTLEKKSTLLRSSNVDQPPRKTGSKSSMRSSTSHIGIQSRGKQRFQALHSYEVLNVSSDGEGSEYPRYQQPAPSKPEILVQIEERAPCTLGQQDFQRKREQLRQRLLSQPVETGVVEEDSLQEASQSLNYLKHMGLFFRDPYQLVFTGEVHLFSKKETQPKDPQMMEPQTTEQEPVATEQNERPTRTELTKPEPEQNSNQWMQLPEGTEIRHTCAPGQRIFYPTSNVTITECLPPSVFLNRQRSESLSKSPAREPSDSDDGDEESSDYSLASSYDEQVANAHVDKDVSVSNSSGLNKSALPSTNASQIVRTDSQIKDASKKELFREKKKTAEFNLLHSGPETSTQKKPPALRIQFCMPRRSQFSKRISQTELSALQDIKNYSDYMPLPQPPSPPQAHSFGKSDKRQMFDFKAALPEYKTSGLIDKIDENPTPRQTNGFDEGSNKSLSKKQTAEKPAPLAALEEKKTLEEAQQFKELKPLKRKSTLVRVLSQEFLKDSENFEQEANASQLGKQSFIIQDRVEQRWNQMSGPQSVAGNDFIGKFGGFSPTAGRGNPISRAGDFVSKRTDISNVVKAKQLRKIEDSLAKLCEFAGADSVDEEPEMAPSALAVTIREVKMSPKRSLMRLKAAQISHKKRDALNITQCYQSAQKPALDGLSTPGNESLLYSQIGVTRPHKMLQRRR